MQIRWNIKGGGETFYILYITTTKTYYFPYGFSSSVHSSEKKEVKQ